MIDGEKSFLALFLVNTHLFCTELKNEERDTHTPEHDFLSKYTTLEIEMIEQRDSKITLKGCLLSSTLNKNNLSFILTFFY